MAPRNSVVHQTSPCRIRQFFLITSSMSRSSLYNTQLSHCVSSTLFTFAPQGKISVHLLFPPPPYYWRTIFLLSGRQVQVPYINDVRTSTGLSVFSPVMAAGARPT